ncbi:MAG: Uma2 family endonuclease [Candidatus Omnitrophota bacterium]
MSIQTLKRLFTIEEYYQMGRSGIFTEDDHVELIEGEIIQMTPIGNPHAGCVKWLIQFFRRRIGEEFIIGAQDPLRLSVYSEPQPDVVLLKPRLDYYRNAHPVPDDVFLLIEVADSSLGYDKNLKIPLYAKHNIIECWLVNLQDKNIEVYRQPSENGYRQILTLAPDQTLSPQAFPDILVKAGDILGI